MSKTNLWKRIIELERENTRVIYNGIKRLNNMMTDEEMTEEKILNKVKQEYEECIEESGEWLRQNPMYDFFRFERIGDPSNEIDRIGYMTLLYREISRMLDEHQTISYEKQYVYRYTVLCKYMNQIAQSTGCSLVHLTNSGGHVLAEYSSEFNVKNEVKNNRNLVLKIQTVLQNSNSVDSDGTVNFNGDMLVLMLLVSRHKEEKYKQKVCIVLENPRNDIELISRSILFLRQQLQTLLERDLYALQHFQVSYEAIMSLNDSKLQILHITDLHVSEENCDQMINLIRENKFMYKEKENREEILPDLILITGDVAQGRDSASDMESNYLAAARVIRELVKKIWFENTKVSKEKLADWKKRIVIIPGNHDYASMNELKATHYNRTTLNGTPANEEGSTMVKFGYFINFLQQLLDIDMAEAIQSGLNEYRIYDAMGLEVLCLNTVAGISMWRNNKMTLDEKFIAQLPKKENTIKSNFIIHVGHHTPMYHPSYNTDSYWMPKITKEKIAILDEAVELVRKIMESSQEYSSSSDEGEKVEKILNSIYYKTLEKSNRNSALYSDITYLLKHAFEKNNERCKNIITNYEKNSFMEEIDYKRYQKNYKELNDKIPRNVFLGGHTHQAAYNTDKTIFEGHRFFDSNASDTEIQYGILTIDKKTQKMEYYFCPDSANEK